MASALRREEWAPAHDEVMTPRCGQTAWPAQGCPWNAAAGLDTKPGSGLAVTCCKKMRYIRAAAKTLLWRIPGGIVQTTMFLVAFAIGLSWYFAPALIAASRRDPNTSAIFTLNLLLGWSVIGWVLAMKRAWSSISY